MSDIRAAAQAQINESASKLAEEILQAWHAGVLGRPVNLVLEYREKELRGALLAQKLLSGIEAGTLRHTQEALNTAKAHIELLQATVNTTRNATVKLTAEVKRIEEVRDIEGRDAALRIEDLRVELRRCRDSWNSMRDESEGWKEQLEDAQRKLTEAKAHAQIDASTLSYRKQELADKCQSWNLMRDEAVGYKQELASCREELRGAREALKEADAHFQETDREEAAQSTSGGAADPLLATKAFRAASRRAAWRSYMCAAMTLRTQFAFDQFVESADKALEAEEARFGAFK